MDASAQSPPIKPISRREFLYYLLMGSMTLVGVSGSAALYRYATKRTFNGVPENVVEIPFTDISDLSQYPVFLTSAVAMLTSA